MMFLKAMQNIRFVARSTSLCSVLTTEKSLCAIKPVQTVLKRNASIHTRHFLIQKAKLEHIDNFGVFLLIFPIASFGLGVWQIKRKIWKERLVAELKHKTSKEPIDLPDNLTYLNNLEYEPVRVRGHFLHEKEVFLGPRTLIEPEDGKKKGGVFTVAPKSGYLVITPFKLENREETILVNRGWVPKAKKNANSRKEGQIEGDVEIVGIVRKHENRPQFMPKMSDNQLYLFRDVNKMSSILNTEPYYLDATVQSNVPYGPIGGQTTVTLRNEHLSYIVTWFSLSGLTSYFWYKLVYLTPK